MCLGFGTEMIPQLNLGAVGLLIPSLAELGSVEGNDPLLLLLRPTTAVDFTIGEGTEVSPSLTTAKPTLEIHPLGIGGKDDVVSFSALELFYFARTLRGCVAGSLDEAALTFPPDPATGGATTRCRPPA